MQKLKIHGVDVFADEKIFSKKELTNYVDKFSEELKPLTLKEISVKLAADGKVDIETTCENKFERIRRITGYLTGDLNSWNNAKKAEEKERVKHYVCKGVRGEPRI